MRKLAAVLGLLVTVSLASAAPIATTDFLGVNKVGPNQMLDLTTHGGSTVDAGVASAAWTSGPDLTAVGTPGSNSFWATGWSNNPGDYFKLSVTLAADYSAMIEQLRFGANASGTGPRNGLVTIWVNGTLEYNHAYTHPGTSSNWQNIDLTGLTVAAPAGATIEVLFTPTGASNQSQGTYRVGSYYTGSTYLPTGILGTTTYIPEPASLVLVALGALAGLRRR